MTKRETFIRAAERCIGTPFHRGGRLIGVGLDCYGLLVVAARAVHVEVDVPQEMNRRWSHHWKGLDAIVRSKFAEVLGGWLPGDIGLFRLRRGLKAAPHVGILVEGGIIQADNRIGAVVKTPYDDTWRGSQIGVFRIVEFG